MPGHQRPFSTEMFSPPFFRIPTTDSHSTFLDDDQPTGDTFQLRFTSAQATAIRLHLGASPGIPYLILRWAFFLRHDLFSVVETFVAGEHQTGASPTPPFRFPYPVLEDPLMELLSSSLTTTIQDRLRHHILHGLHALSTTPLTIGSRSIDNRLDPIPIGGLLLIVIGID